MCAAQSGELRVHAQGVPLAVKPQAGVHQAATGDQLGGFAANWLQVTIHMCCVLT